jgi:glycosyltransferase involved in cell wall biosynthesis
MIDTYIISTYRPRFCGIAEFSANIVDALTKYRKTNSDIGDIKVAAIDVSEREINYSSNREVFSKIEQNEEESWIEIAESINKRIADGKKIGRKGIVFANMEYGIIGDYGKKQDNLTPFLQKLREAETKSVVQIHTLPNPSHPDFKYQLETLQKISQNTDAIVSISCIAGDMMLMPPYNLENNIVYIDHGVRAVNYRKEDRTRAKKKYGLEDKIVVATFGFNSPGKGRDYSAIAHSEFLKSLSESQRKRVVYLMAGGFHPDFVQQEGGKYYQEYKEKFNTNLESSGVSFKEVTDPKQIKQEDWEKNDIIILNKLLSNNEFKTLFTAADLVINPTRDRMQVSSGILAEVLGYGKACISTDSLYARETLLPEAAVVEEINKRKNINDDERQIRIWGKSQGIVVPLIDTKKENTPIPDIESIEKGEGYLLFEPIKNRKEMESRARVKGRRMGWGHIAGDYHRLFQDLIEDEEKRDEKVLFLRNTN